MDCKNCLNTRKHISLLDRITRLYVEHGRIDIHNNSMGMTSKTPLLEGIYLLLYYFQMGNKMSEALQLVQVISKKGVHVTFSLNRKFF